MPRFVARNRQTTATGRLGVKFMPLVFDHKAQVRIARKFQGKLNLGYVGHIDSVCGVASDGAVAARRVVGVTCPSLVERRVHAGRVIDALHGQPVLLEHPHGGEVHIGISESPIGT